MFLVVLRSNSSYVKDNNQTEVVRSDEKKTEKVQTNKVTLHMVTLFVRLR